MNIILFDSMTDTLSSEDARFTHVRDVLGLKEGDTFQMGIVGGAKGEATILEMGKEGMRFSFVPTEKDAFRMYPLSLIVGQVRPICMRRILRECVDLGVETLVLTTCDLTEKSYQYARLYTAGEYRSILLDGAMQSGKTGISEVRFASSVEESLSKVPSGARKILLDNVIGKESLSSLSIAQEERVVMAIGPERGFSDRERGIFLEAGYQPVLVGSRILRTETVCSAATAIMLGRMGLI